MITLLDEDEENQKKLKDNFLMENLPSASDMISLTLNNKDLLYYPFNTKQNKYIEVFDISCQKKLGDTEEPQPTAPQTKQTKPRNQPQKRSHQNKNTYQPNLQRFDVTQSIVPDSSWTLIQDFNKYTLEKFTFDNKKIRVSTKGIYGNIYPINDSFEEEVSPYNPKALKDYSDYKFYGNTNTQLDKILTGDSNADIYITDKILSVIMTCIYTAHPWHLKITKMGQKIFFEKMDNSEIDLVTVNESDNTSTIYDDSNINSYRNLNIEATLINEFFKEQILNIDEEKKLPDTQPNPLKEEDDEDDKVEHLGYVYKVWNLDGLNVFVRSQVHAYAPVENEEKTEESEDKSDSDEEDEDKDKDSDVKKEEKKNYEFINIFAMNEYDKNYYLTKESNLGANIIKKELKNNYLKLVKWGILSYLGGAKTIKIGCVTRKNVNDKNNHLISTTYNLGLDDLLQLTNFNKDIAWGIFKEIISQVQNHKENGSFILMKTFGETSSKSLLKLFKVPDSYFKEEEEEDMD